MHSPFVSNRPKLKIVFRRIELLDKGTLRPRKHPDYFRVTIPLFIIIHLFRSVPVVGFTSKICMFKPSDKCNILRDE